MLKIKNTVKRAEGGVWKIVNFRIACACAVFLCLGIAFGYARITAGLSYWWLALLLLFTGLIFYFSDMFVHMRKCAIVALALWSFFAVGVISFSAHIRDFTSATVYDGEYAVCGRVVERETDGENYYITLDKLYIDGNAEKGRLVAYLPAPFYNMVALSDTVVLRGDVRTQVRLFGKYGFRSYVIENDERYYAYVESGIVTGNTHNLFLLVRSRIENVVYAGMDEGGAAVTMAVLTGDTSGIDEGLLENIRRGGIAHIFAVSGLHIGALYAFCLFLLQKTGLKRLSNPFRFIFVATVLIFYGGVCGFSASVMRALITCLLFYATKLLGIGGDTLENLGVAAIIILLLSPFSLFAAGFQLSFAACIGIAFLARPISSFAYAAGDKIQSRLGVKRTLPTDDDTQPLSVGARIVRGCISFFSVSLAAQIATTPILLQTFGYLSGWSLLLNCMFVPLIGAAFSVLLVFVFLACLLPTAISGVILYVPNVVWSAVLLVFDVIDFSSFALVGWQVYAPSYFSYYTACFCGSDKWNVPKSYRRTVCVLSLLAFVITMYAFNL